jgi:hypothetical protein
MCTQVVAAAQVMASGPMGNAFIIACVFGLVRAPAIRCDSITALELAQIEAAAGVALREDSLSSLARTP